MIDDSADDCKSAALALALKLLLGERIIPPVFVPAPIPAADDSSADAACAVEERRDDEFDLGIAETFCCPDGDVGEGPMLFAMAL